MTIQHKILRNSGYIGHQITPLQYKINKLNEEYHIYKRDNLNYNNQIKKALLSCINDLINNHNLQKIRISVDIDYASYSIKNIIPNINEIVLYIGFYDNEQNAVNITTIDEENIEGLVHITSSENGFINKAAIVMEIPEHYDIDECLGMIHHELLHLLHKVNSPNISEIAGNAYTYADMLAVEMGLSGIPNVDNLIYIDNLKTLTLLGLTGTLCLCMYLLDKDEIQAWRESFNKSNIKRIKYSYNSKDIQNLYINDIIYKTYNYLYKCIIKYYHELCTPYKTLSVEADNILRDYFKTCHNIVLKNNYNLKEIIDNKWIPACENQLKTFRNLHAFNLNKITNE